MWSSIHTTTSNVLLGSWCIPTSHDGSSISYMPKLHMHVTHIYRTPYLYIVDAFTRTPYDCRVVYVEGVIHNSLVRSSQYRLILYVDRIHLSQSSVNCTFHHNPWNCRRKQQNRTKRIAQSSSPWKTVLENTLNHLETPQNSRDIIFWHPHKISKQTFITSHWRSHTPFIL